MNLVRPRLGIASVIGVLFMTFVFVLAIGAQQYVSGLQAQSYQMANQAERRFAQHIEDSILFGGQSTGTTATNRGPATTNIVGMILKFENGTTYVLNSGSTPPFVGAVVPTGASVGVQSLVPSGLCTPGSATCLSKFNAIVTGGPVSGRGVGLITGNGNVFWYTPLALSGFGSSSGTYYHTSAPQSTTSSTFVPVPGLAFTGSANSFYVVDFAVGYYQSNTASPVLAFAISLPAGATFLFCGGLYWSDSAQSTTDFTPSNLCTGSVNTSLGSTHNMQTFCTSGNICEWVGTASITFGSTGGQFQFEFEGSSTDTATVAADSMIVVTNPA